MKLNLNRLEQILLSVNKPSRYLGGELNSCRKNWDEASVRLVFAFPDTYEVGMSHFGMGLLYHLVNSHESFLADRVYAPWIDMEKKLGDEQIPLFSLDQRRALGDFDIIGFSLQYELSYSNILTILHLSRIPFFSKNRQEDDWPLIIGGGPCVFNAEPIASFFDFFILGEAEEVLMAVLERVAEWKRDKTCRRELFEELRFIRGVYIPAFFRDRYDTCGKLVAVEPVYPDYTEVKKAVIANLDADSPTPIKPIVPFMKIVHDRLNLEIARGCTRGCRFCQAGMIYRPVRERNPRILLSLADEALKNTGFEEISLLSLSSGDYSNIEQLLTTLIAKHFQEKVSVALPSLRVGTLSPSLIREIKKVRKTGFTLAPEAGSERLRRVINKDISTNELLNISESIYSNGWQLIKLYFMMGLPTENENDLEELVSMCHKVWNMGKYQKPRGRLNISISTFVPKPQTPFQWSSQIPLVKIHQNLAFLKRRLNKRGMRLKWHNPLQSFLEAVFARGDRRLANVILGAWKMGARFDGWTEQFAFPVWEKALKESGIPAKCWMPEERHLEDVLAWDHLSSGVEKTYLKREYEEALSEEYTNDCRWSKCLKCGACDFKEVQPIVYKDIGNTWSRLEAEKATHIQKRGGSEGELRYAKKAGYLELYHYRCRFTKTGPAKFLSHLEMMETISRACRRASLPIAFSRGFNPHMRISFWHALPLGFESLAEFMIMSLEKPLDENEVTRRLNKELPYGIEILHSKKLGQPSSWPQDALVRFRVELTEGSWPEEKIEGSLLHPRIITKKTKRGKEKVFKSNDYIETIKFLDSKTLEIVIKQSSSGGPTLLEILEVLFGKEYAKLPNISVVKVETSNKCGEDPWQ